MTKKPAAMPQKRTPNGAVSARPIALRLLPDELAEVKELAAKQDRSMANVCRRLVLSSLRKPSKAASV